MKSEYKQYIFSFAFISGIIAFIIGSIAYCFYNNLVIYAISTVTMILFLPIILLTAPKESEK